MNLVLYRKYRPKTFNEVIGQEHIVKTLTNSLAAGMVGHAYLFAGPRGTGKTTVARLLAKALNCQNRKEGQSEPCNQCDSCTEVNQGNAIDLIEIDAATATGIDNIRDLKEGIRFLPAKSKYKVFIIDECHQLSKDASNGLLKTLEEPPSHAIFILATTEFSKMIPTIVSRCQAFSFRRLRLLEITGRLEKILKQEDIKYEKSALDLIALASTGALRDAESLLDQAVCLVGQDGLIERKEVQTLLGLADNAAVLRFLGLLQKKDAKEAIEFINGIVFQGVDLREFAKSLLHFIREILFFKIAAELESPLLFSLTQEEKNELKKLAGNWLENDIKKMLEILSEAENKMKYAVILQLPLELAIIDVCFKNT